jgi:hypothetical protein
MPSFFSRLKGKDSPSKAKKGAQQTASNDVLAKPRWDDAWTRKTVEPDEVQELLRGCTAELKSRGMDGMAPAGRECTIPWSHVCIEGVC